MRALQSETMRGLCCSLFIYGVGGLVAVVVAAVVGSAPAGIAGSGG